MNIIINSIFSKDSILKPLYKSKVTFAKYMFFTVICFSFFGVFTSCQTLKPSRQIIISRKIADTGFLSSSQLAAFFIQENPSYNKKDIQKLAEYYVSESKIEGINSDVAFAQMCLETGFLRFGGLVQPEWHNYCGLGAIDKENPGCIFETEQLGVRAHIQHLQAYATTPDVELNQELVDPRYSWVHKTKMAYTIEDLTGNWAADANYDKKIEAILQRMEMFVNK